MALRRTAFRAGRTEWPLVALLVAGAVLRVVTSVAYRPALVFFQDSFDYLGDAQRLRPGVIRPLAYPFFLRLLSAGGRLELVPATQHVLGLAAGAALYVLLRHLGVRPWLAGLGAAPVLLDGYQVYLEHFVMAEALFAALVVTATTLLLWPERPGPTACVAVGVVLAVASLTRTVGLVLFLPALGFLAARRVGALRVGCATAAAVAVLGAYALWFSAAHGRIGLEAYSGFFMAGRVAPFADCGALRLPPEEQPLCVGRDVEDLNTDWYVWDVASPLRQLPTAAGIGRDALARRYAGRVIRSQPGDYLWSVAGDTIHYLAATRHTGSLDFPVAAWQFRTAFTPDPWRPVSPPPDPYRDGWTWPGDSLAHNVTVAAHGFDLARVRPRLHPGAARFLATYQRYAYTTGPLLAVALVLGLFAGTGRLRDRRPRRLRHAGVFLAISGFALLAVPAATSVFDFRYLLPSLVLLPPAGAIGLTLVLERRAAVRS